jgi:hypothetical protein
MIDPAPATPEASPEKPEEAAQSPQSESIGSWVAKAWTLVRDRLQGFPSIRKAEQISGHDRETCARYGEHVIGTMLAGGLAPKSEDLLAIYQSETSRQSARDWLTERADYYERWEEWRSLRELLLEGAVIGLILIEILLSIVFGTIGICEGVKQGQVLDRQATLLEHMDRAASDTAATVHALKTDQEKSVERLKEMNENLRESATAMADQLKILRQQQGEHLAQLAKKAETGPICWKYQSSLIPGTYHSTSRRNGHVSDIRVRAGERRRC